MIVRKVLGVIILCLIVWGISRAPGQWATAVHHAGDHVSDGVAGFGTFLTRVLA